jgi:long-subunit fatty acid transport protein
VTITDYKKNEFKGFYVNGGIALDITDNLTAAAIFRSPYSKESESKSSLSFTIPEANTDIRIEAAATNTFQQPLILGVGFDYRLNQVLRVASDVSFFNWSSYSVEYYDEELERAFKNIIKIGGGLEYLSSLNIFGQDVLMPLRIGMIYDPQPMKEPSSRYLYYTLGIGFYWRGLRLDTGTCFGNEKGSGQDLIGRRFSASLSFSL